MKAYTDLEQSKKLAEILSLESADMCYQYQKDRWVGEPDYKEYPQFEIAMDKRDIPCWSLAALLSVIPEEINALGTIYSINIHTKNEKWFIDYKCNNEEFIGVHSNIFLDACYEMIIKLHEQKLL